MSVIKLTSFSIELSTGTIETFRLNDTYRSIFLRERPDYIQIEVTEEIEGEVKVIDVVYVRANTTSWAYERLIT